MVTYCSAKTLIATYEEVLMGGANLGGLSGVPLCWALNTPIYIPSSA